MSWTSGALARRIVLVLVPPAAAVAVWAYGARASRDIDGGHALGVSAAAAAETPGFALPDSALPEGWRMSGPVERFPADRMFEKINGADEAFLRRGVRELMYQGFETEDGDAADVFIYDMQTDEAAAVMFVEDSGMEPGRREEFGGDIAVAESTVYLRCNRFYVQIFASAPDGTEVALTLGRGVDRILTAEVLAQGPETGVKP